MVIVSRYMNTLKINRHGIIKAIKVWLKSEAVYLSSQFEVPNCLLNSSLSPNKCLHMCALLMPLKYICLVCISHILLPHPVMAGSKHFMLFNTYTLQSHLFIAGSLHCATSQN